MRAAFILISLLAMVIYACTHYQHSKREVPYKVSSLRSGRVYTTYLDSALKQGDYAYSSLEKVIVVARIK